MTRLLCADKCPMHFLSSIITVDKRAMVALEHLHAMVEVNKLLLSFGEAYIRVDRKVLKAEGVVLRHEGRFGEQAITK